MIIHQASPDDAQEMEDISKKLLSLYTSLDTEWSKFATVLLHVIASQTIKRDSVTFYCVQLMELWDAYDKESKKSR